MNVTEAFLMLVFVLGVIVIGWAAIWLLRVMLLAMAVVILAILAPYTDAESPNPDALDRIARALHR